MRTKQGTVISTKSDKTAIVRVDRYVSHPKYGKRYRVSKRFHAHDEESKATEGAVVIIEETRPVSKLKCWKIKEIVTAGEEVVAPAKKAAKKETTEEKTETESTEK